MDKTPLGLLDLYAASRGHPVGVAVPVIASLIANFAIYALHLGLTGEFPAGGSIQGKPTGVYLWGWGGSLQG